MGDVYSVAVGVPVLLVKVHARLNILGGLVVSEVSLHVGGVRVEVHLAQDTLSVGQVGTSQGLDLVVLERTVLVPEAFGASTS